jgi:hypothetical protein
MSLQESEVVDRIRTSLREAIDASKTLAIASWRGVAYEKLRTHLGLVEGACRQLAIFREDYRWLNFGMRMAICHQMAGDRLRGYTKNGIHITWTMGHQNEWFIKLAAELTYIADVLDKLVTAKTERTGPILPVPQDDGRAMGERAREVRPQGKRGSLIVPPKYRRTA